MNKLFFLIAPVLLSTQPFAQTNFPEIEPNSAKFESTVVNGISAGDTITGVTTGTTATSGSTLSTTVDTFRVKTSALPLGLYQHRLTLTTSTVTGNTGTIRGLNQTGTVGVGGTAGTVDSQLQTAITTSTPPRFNQWYGFGKQEELYYRVTGTTATTAQYTATMSTAAVSPTVIVPVFESAAPITITTVGQTTVDTELLLYDVTFTPVPGGLNDDEGAGPTTQSRLTRTLAPGTYYLAVATFELCSNQVAPADDDFVGGLLADFPDCVVLSNSSLASVDYDFQIIAANVTHTQTNQLPANSPFTVTWFQFTTAPVAPGAPPNDNCANASPLLGGSTAVVLTGATHDGTASCDAGGAASKDVWYTFQAGSVAGTLNLDTCSTSGMDPVVTVLNSCGGTELACSDNCAGAPCGGPNACVSGLHLNGNQLVVIRLSDKGLGGTSMTINVTFDPDTLANDECATPIVLAGPGTYPIDNSTATTGSQGQAEAQCLFFATTAIARDLWYSYTATQSAAVTVSTCGLIATGPSQDSKIAVYSGSGCPLSGSSIGCNDDAACPGFSALNASVTFNALCGNTYTFQLGMYGGTVTSMSGSFSVTEAGGIGCNTPTIPFCLGDGTDAPCPCANSGAAGNGCANASFLAGAHLAATGIAGASNATDTLVLTATNIPGPGMFFQASGLSAHHLGDGRLCAYVDIVRLGMGMPSSGTASYPAGGTPIHTVGATQSGDTRHYQTWYRTVPSLCGAGNYDLTQGVTLTWSP